MEFVKVICEDDTNPNKETIAEYKKNYNGIDLKFTWSPKFKENNNISDKTLQRYRQKIKNDRNSDPYLYFNIVNDQFYYTDRILSLRKYKNALSVTENVRPIYYRLDHGKYKLENKHSPIFSNIKAYEWSYACGTRYKNNTDIESCREKMQRLYNAAVNQFGGSAVTMFYTTEHDEDDRDKLHNHFVFSVTGGNHRNVGRMLKSLMLCTGTKVPWIERFNTADPAYLEYMIKHVKEYPDGWAILSNSKAEIDQLTPRAAIATKARLRA